MANRWMKHFMIVHMLSLVVFIRKKVFGFLFGRPTNILTTIQTRKKQEELNQKLTLEISQLESEIRGKFYEVIESISKQEKTSNVYHSPPLVASLSSCVLR